MGKAKYCKHCGHALTPPPPPVPGLTLEAVEQRLATVEARLLEYDMADPRLGAEGWADTIRRIARDVVRREGR